MERDVHGLLELAEAAWAARASARILGRTAVGCAVRGSNGGVWVGCNIEHQFRSHDIHAETNAISTMVTASEQRLVAIVVVAERDRFTPCGACLDWIMEFGGPACLVGFQRGPGEAIDVLTAGELMPHYPH